MFPNPCRNGVQQDRERRELDQENICMEGSATYGTQGPTSFDVCTGPGFHTKYDGLGIPMTVRFAGCFCVGSTLPSPLL